MNITSKFIAQTLSAASMSLMMAMIAVPSHANDAGHAVMAQKKVAEKPQLRAYNMTITRLSRRIEQLEERGKAFDGMSKAQQRKFENDVGGLYTSVQNATSATSMRLSSGGTGTVDCAYACESEYSRCQRMSSDWLCRIQAMKCLIKCGVGASISTGTIAQ